MKQYILIFFCFVMMSSPMSSKLRLLNISGQVLINDANGSHTALPYEYVDNGTIIHLSAGSKLSIVDETTNAVYYSPEKSGDITVRRIIREARRKADNTTAAIARKVMESCDRDSHMRNPRKGVSYRDQTTASETESAIAAIISKASAPENHFLKCEMIEKGNDSLWYFRIENDKNGPFYINVAKLGNEDHPACLMMPVGYDDDMPYILVGPGQTDFVQYLFYGVSPDNLLLISSSEPFDTNLVNTLLKQNRVTSPLTNSTSITLNKINIGD